MNPLFLPACEIQNRDAIAYAELFLGDLNILKIIIIIIIKRKRFVPEF